MADQARVPDLPDYAFAPLRALLDPTLPGAAPFLMARSNPAHRRVMVGRACHARLLALAERRPAILAEWCRVALGHGTSGRGHIRVARSASDVRRGLGPVPARLDA